MSKQEEIIEVCGKKVVVRYTRDCQPCEKCVFDESNLCAHAKDKCVELDRVGMEICERAYFVDAEQPEDIKIILTLYHNVIGDGIENIYPEVLKRFNEIKFKK